MSHDAHSSSSTSQNNPTQWTEPPWSGWIETTGDALLILEAARRGLIPRVTRRLVDSERKMITSGSVFVFDEDESGIKRWTDGFFWSPSRILGNFLLYRETEKRGAGHRSARSERETVEPTEQSQISMDGVKLEGGQTLSRPKSESTRLGIDRQRERSLVGSLTNSYKFKPGGMMKKTFSLTIGGVAQHLISYYKVEDVEQGRLRSPSSLPELASLDISPEYLDKTHFRNPPKVEIGVDGVPRYRGEADDVDTSPHLTTIPLSTPSGYGDQGSGKRGKRYDPYGAPKSPKRVKKKNTRSQDGVDLEPVSPTYSPTTHSSAPTYPDTTTSLAATTNHHYTPYMYYPAYHPPMYSAVSTAYSGSSGSPIATQSTSTTSSTPAALTYPGYGSESQPSSAQPASYPYYPPQSATFPPYWQHYSPYTPTQAAVSQQSPTITPSGQPGARGEGPDDADDDT